MTWTGWNALFVNKRAHQLAKEANSTSHTAERHADIGAQIEHPVHGSVSLGEGERRGSAARKKLKTAVGHVFRQQNIKPDTVANDGPNQSTPCPVFTDCNGNL